MFSIIIPTLNEEKLLPDLLQSLANQSDNDFEVIVVDGMSTDKTSKIVKIYQNKFKKIIFATTKTRNISFQRNYGSKIAQGSWLIFIDADAILVPDFIHQLEEYIRKVPRASFITTWCKVKSRKLNDSFVAWFQNISLAIGEMVGIVNSPGSMTIIKKEIFTKNGLYNYQYKYAEDLELTLRIINSGYRLFILKKPLYYLSLRRYLKDGLFSIYTLYVKTLINAYLFHRIPEYSHLYQTGGHNYDAKKNEYIF
jgi:glycosyltransferase involved in cell wall biosynthesis